jgi:putative ABC transport system permease protein
MAARELLSTAVHSLRINPLRSSLSVLGVVMAIAIVMVLISMGSGVRGEIVSQIESLGSNLLVVRSGGEETGSETAGASGPGQLSLSSLGEEDVAVARGVEAVSLCSGTIEGPVQVYGPDGDVLNSKLIGVDEAFWRIREVDLRRGEKVVDGTGNCVIGSTLASEFFSGLPEEGLGEAVSVGQTELRVAGVAASRPRSLIGDPNREIYVSLTDARSLFAGGGTQVSMISASVSTDSDVEAAKEDLRSAISTAHGGKADFNVASQEDLVASYDRILSLLNSLVAGIAIAALAVGGVGIANIMYISVKERTSEIGILMAQGATKADIIRQFIAEAVILCAIGGIVGVPLGILVSRLVDRFSIMTLSTPPWVILVALAAALATGVLAGVFPSIQATRIDIGDALRKE